MIWIVIASVIVSMVSLIYAAGMKIENESATYRLENTERLLELKERQYEEMKAFAGEGVEMFNKIGDRIGP